MWIKKKTPSSCEGRRGFVVFADGHGARPCIVVENVSFYFLFHDLLSVYDVYAMG